MTKANANSLCCSLMQGKSVQGFLSRSLKLACLLVGFCKFLYITYSSSSPLSSQPHLCLIFRIPVSAFFPSGCVFKLACERVEFYMGFHTPFLLIGPLPYPLISSLPHPSPCLSLSAFSISLHYSIMSIPDYLPSLHPP